MSKIVNDRKKIRKEQTPKYHQSWFADDTGRNSIRYN